MSVKKAPLQELEDAAHTYRRLFAVFRKFYDFAQGSNLPGVTVLNSLEGLPWFDMKFADVRLRIALSARRLGSDRGELFCYRFPMFFEDDPTVPTELIDKTEFLVETGETPLTDLQGGPVFLTLATSVPAVLAPWIVEALHKPRGGT